MIAPDAVKTGTLTVVNGDLQELANRLAALLMPPAGTANATILMHTPPGIPGCQSGVDHICLLPAAAPPVATTPTALLTNPTAQIFFDQRLLISAPAPPVSDLLALFTNRLGVDLSPYRPEIFIQPVEIDVDSPLRIVTSLAEAGDEILVELNPAALALRSGPRGSGVYFPVTLEFVERDGSPWRTLESCSERGNTVGGTLPNSVCGPLVRRANDAQPLGSCEQYDFGLEVRRLRVHIGFIPFIRVGCTPQAAIDGTPSVDWMGQAPFGVDYRQGCLGVRADVIVEPVSTSDMHLTSVFFKDCNFTGCELLPVGFCEDIAIDAAQESLSDLVAPILGPAVSDELKPLFEYDGALYRDPPDNLPCSSLLATGCATLAFEDFLPAALTRLAYGWFANEFAPTLFRRDHLPVVDVRATCQGDALRETVSGATLCRRFQCLATDGPLSACGFLKDTDESGHCETTADPEDCANPPFDTGLVPPLSLEFDALFDADGDGLTGDDDTCPRVAGTADDWDGDGLGDTLCDPCPCSPDEDPERDGDQDGVCDTCNRFGGFGDCFEYCPANPPDNCVDVANPDQLNCNEEAERANGFDLVNPAFRVVGDACDPTPCAAGQAAPEPLFMDQGAGPCEASLAGRSAACTASMNTRLRWTGFVEDENRAFGQARIAHCECDEPHATIEERLGRNRSGQDMGVGCQRDGEGRTRCVSGDARAFPRNPTLASKWRSLTTEAATTGVGGIALPGDTPLVRNGSYRTQYLEQGGTPRGTSWRFERDFASFGVCVAPDDGPDCDSILDVPPEGISSALSFLVARPGKKSVAEAMDGVSWVFTHRFRGVELLPIAPDTADLASHYFAHNLVAGTPLRVFVPPDVQYLPPSTDPCRIDPVLCLATDVRTFADQQPTWTYVTATDGALHVQNGQVFASTTQPDTGVLGLLSTLGTDNTFVAPSEPVAVLRRREIFTVGAVVQTASGALTATLEQRPGEAIRVALSGDGACPAGTILSTCDAGFKCSVPCDGVVGDQRGVGLPDSSCRIAFLGEAGANDEDHCARLACAPGTIDCVTTDVCATPCDEVVECPTDDTPILDEGAGACGALGMSARTMSGLRNELYVVSNDDGLGEHLAIMDLDDGRIRIVPLEDFVASGHPLALAYLHSSDTLYLLDEVATEGPGGHDRAALRLVRLDREGNGRVIGHARLRRARDRDLFLTATDDDQLLLAVSGPQRQSPAYAVLRPALHSVRVVETFLHPRRGELVGAPDTRGSYGYGVVVREGRGHSHRPDPRTVVDGFDFTEISRTDFHVLRRDRRFEWIGRWL